MDITSRKLFNNNKITEAICQFTFNTHPDTNLYSQFCESILSSNIYTEKQEIPLIHFNINLSQSSQEKLIFNGLKLLNKKKDKVIQLLHNNLSIHQVGHYQKWELFQKDILAVLIPFQKIFNCQIVRIDLRTINIFDDFKNDSKLEDYFKINLRFPTNLIPSSNYSFALEHTYEHGKIGVVRGNYIKQQNAEKFVYDLSYVLLCQDNAIDIHNTTIIVQKLEEGHLKLYDLFINSITDKTEKLIQ